MTIQTRTIKWLRVCLQCISYLLLQELNVDSLPLEQIGPLFEHHEMFPARTNTGVHCLPLQLETLNKSFWSLDFGTLDVGKLELGF